MKAITLWQPWATLVAIGAKTIETRSWPTPYRGPVAIHASKKWDRNLATVARSVPFARVLLDARHRVDLHWYGPRGSLRTYGLPLGAVVAVADLVDCLPTSTHTPRGPSRNWVADLSEQERAFGDFGPNRFGWILRDVRRLAVPVPTPGRQGIFDLGEEVADLVAFSCSANR